MHWATFLPAMSFDEFKSKTKAWECVFSQCKLYKTYVLFKQSIVDDQSTLDNQN